MLGWQSARTFLYQSLHGRKIWNKINLNKLLIIRMLEKVNIMKIINYQDLEAQEAKEGASKTNIAMAYNQRDGGKKLCNEAL